MSGRIPEDIIEKIRDEISIEDAIGHFLPLKQKGRSFWGLCPFHQEKTPSFHVHPERQIFYCFGCGRGGNVFRFLMDREGMSFPEAVQWCASRIGLDLARFLHEDDGEDGTRGRLFAANQWAADWFAEQLEGPGGEQARRYVHERGFNPETVQQFGVGYAPEGSGALQAAARHARLSEESLLQTSLLRRSEGRAPFAYFRSRLIFPIQGVAKKVYGFGGRILGPGEPKYLNSPETSIFQKRRVLYALGEARARIIRVRRAVLVEGYMDALALHQAGWSETVATCGTALTPEQVQMLGRFADRVVLLFDGDTAGRKAAYKAADVALTAGIDVRIAHLPEGQDPADLLKADDVDTLRRAIEEAPGLVQCLLDEVESRGGGRELKERALRHLRELLPKVPDPIRAELLLQEAAEAFHVPERLLRPAKSAQSARPDEARLPQESGQRAETERRLLGLAMASRQARHLLAGALRPEDFLLPRMRGMFERLAALDDDVDRVRDGDFAGLQETEERLLARLLIEMPEPELDAVAELSAALSHLEDLSRRESARKHRRQLDEAYRSGDDWKSHLDPHASDEERAGPTQPSSSESDAAKQNPDRGGH